MPNPYAVGALAGFELISGFQQADMIRKHAEISSQISEMNAEFAELDASRAEMEGFSDAAEYQSVIDQTLADQAVAYTSQGVDITFGTASERQKETRLTGFLNTLDIKNQAHAKALGYKREARDIRLQGTMNKGAASVQAAATQGAAVLGAGKTVGGYFIRK